VRDSIAADLALIDHYEVVIGECHRTLKPGQAGTVESRPLRVAAVSIVDRP
jgi:hypothetical protein